MIEKTRPVPKATHSQPDSSRPRLLYWLILTCAALLLTGCDTNTSGTIDFRGLPPSLHSATVSPESTNIDLLQPTNDLYSISGVLRVVASDPDGVHTISSVIAEFTRPRSGIAFGQMTLKDDGILPDLIAGDGEYAAAFTFTLNRSQTGLYRILITARDRNGLRSNSLVLPLAITRNNSSPALAAESLIAPDTVIRPVTGSSTFFMSISASDPDGLEDIEEVFLLNLQTQNRVFLLDDGGVIQPGGISSGDQVAGDGIFSATLQLPSETPPGVYQFLLQAVDTFRDTSNSVPYMLVVQ